MSAVQRISKPHLVDFLRMCDRNRWCCPRIRYASIRSKPELCEDILKFFSFIEAAEVIFICPLRTLHGFPEMEYHLKGRCFVLDGCHHDFPRLSRSKPVFQLERKRVTLEFDWGPWAPGSDTVSADAPMFPLPSTSTLAIG